MPHWNEEFNNQENGALGSTAPITNVALCSKALLRAVERPAHLPGFVCFYGPSGWGKSMAAAYVANDRRNNEAYYIQCQKNWPQKAFLQNLLKVMGILPEKTIYDMAEQVCEQLANSQMPLIIDEMDHIVNKGYVELIRDIYEGSLAPILIIGEEGLPSKLRKWERFHGRVLDWVPAQPADFDDCKHLARLYCKRVVIKEDLLRKVLTVCKGSTRRIAVNLSNIEEEICSTGLSEVGLKDWGKRPFYTGDAPNRRVSV